jgi:hypothetical protein
VDRPVRYDVSRWEAHADKNPTDAGGPLASGHPAPSESNTMARKRPGSFPTSPADVADWPKWFWRMPPRTRAVVVGGAVALLAVVIWSTSGWWASGGLAGNVHVDLHGAGVAELQPGARVVMGSIPVGEVVGREIRDGVPVAEVAVHGRHARQIPQSSRFEVDSLNQWMPGNLGVRIRGPKRPSDEPPLADGAEIETVDRALPPAVPERFYLLVGLSVAAVLVLALLARFLRSLAILLVGIAVLAAVLVYLSGTIAAA